MPKTKSAAVARVPMRLVDRDDPPREAGRPRPLPPARGRLYYDFQIADAFLAGLPRITDKVRWVREHLPRDSRVKIGHDSAWWETDILSWLARQSAAEQLEAARLAAERAGQMAEPST